MMEDLAMHLIEVLMNSIHALSTTIYVNIFDSKKEDKIELIVEDDGKGMDQEKAEAASSPFMTSRTTRKVGMGLAFLKGLCEMCNGTYRLDSKEKTGTIVYASVQKSHIDTPPLGDIGEMSMATIQANENIHYVLVYQNDSSQFVFDTDQIREYLGDVSLLEPEILLWMKDYINQGIGQLEEDE